MALESVREGLSATACFQADKLDPEAPGRRHIALMLEDLD